MKTKDKVEYLLKHCFNCDELKLFAYSDIGWELISKFFKEFTNRKYIYIHDGLINLYKGLCNECFIYENLNDEIIREYLIKQLSLFLQFNIVNTSKHKFITFNDIPIDETNLAEIVGTETFLYYPYVYTETLFNKKKNFTETEQELKKYGIDITVSNNIIFGIAQLKPYITEVVNRLEKPYPLWI